jgi:hypothetical protein
VSLNSKILHVQSTLLDSYYTNNNINKRGHLCACVLKVIKKRERNFFFCMLQELVWKVTACCDHDDDHQREK